MGNLPRLATKARKASKCCPLKMDSLYQEPINAVKPKERTVRKGRAEARPVVTNS